MKIIVIDDHPLVREGIAAIVRLQEDMDIIGMAGSENESVKILANKQPDVALVDLRLSGEYGLDIIRKGREVAPDCRFVVLTSYCEQTDVRRAMAEKVEGYVLKEALPEELLSALRLVAQGRTYIDPAIVQMLVEGDDANEPIEQLTPREREVLAALANGMDNKEIAGLLFVTEHTVRKHISSILGKLELKDRTQAALYAVAHGGIKPRKVTPEAI